MKNFKSTAWILIAALVVTSPGIGCYQAVAANAALDLPSNVRAVPPIASPIAIHEELGLRTTALPGTLTELNLSAPVAPHAEEPLTPPLTPASAQAPLVAAAADIRQAQAQGGDVAAPVSALYGENAQYSAPLQEVPAAAGFSFSWFSPLKRGLVAAGAVVSYVPAAAAQTGAAPTQTFTDNLRGGDPLSWAIVAVGAVAVSAAALIRRAGRFSRMPAFELSQALRSEKTSDRLGAISAIKKRDDAGFHAGGLISAAETDPKARVRLAAIEAIDEKNMTSGASALARVSRQDADKDVRVAALKALGTLKQAATMDAVSLAIQDPKRSSEEFQAAVASAQEIGGPAAAPALLHAAFKSRHRDDETYGGIIGSLIEIGEPASLQKVGRRVEKELVRALGDEDWEKTATVTAFLDKAGSNPDEDDDGEKNAARADDKNIKAVLAVVTHPNAAPLLARSVTLARDGVDHPFTIERLFSKILSNIWYAWYWGFKWALTYAIAIGVYKAYFNRHEDFDGAEAFGRAHKEFLDIDEEALEKLQELSGAEFESAYGLYFKGKPQLLEAAKNDPEKRLSILLRQGLKPAALTAG